MLYNPHNIVTALPNHPDPSSSTIEYDGLLIVYEAFVDFAPLRKKNCFSIEFEI
jgi:hypothetical protein